MSTEISLQTNIHTVKNITDPHHEIRLLIRNWGKGWVIHCRMHAVHMYACDAVSVVNNKTFSKPSFKEKMLRGNYTVSTQNYE